MQSGPGAWHRFSLGMTPLEMEMHADNQQKWEEVISLVDTFRKFRKSLQREVQADVMHELEVQFAVAKIGDACKFYPRPPSIR